MVTQNINLQSKRQNGAALITALILLVLLTMLGLSSMSTTTMEERMAANTQLINRAFQAASTGIEIAFSDPKTFLGGNSATTGFNKNVGGSGNASYNAVTTYETKSIQQTKPESCSSNSGWDSTFAAYHFDLSATGCIVVDDTKKDCDNAIASNTLHQGVCQIGKGS